MKKLYVGNLPYSITDDQLRELVSKAGTVTSATVITDSYSGRSKGFGFVEMSTDEEAQKAIELFNGYSMDGRTLKVNEARPKEEGRRFGSGSGGGDRPRRSFGDRDRGPRDFNKQY